MKRIRKPNDDSIGPTNRVYRGHDSLENRKDSHPIPPHNFASHQVSNSLEQNHTNSYRASQKEIQTTSSDLHSLPLSLAMNIDSTREAHVQYSALKQKAAQLVDDEQTTLPTTIPAKDIASEPMTGLSSSTSYFPATLREDALYSLLYEPLYACSNSLFYLTPENVAHSGHKMLCDLQKHTIDDVVSRHEGYNQAILSTRSRREKECFNEESMVQERTREKGSSTSTFVLPRIGNVTSHCSNSGRCNYAPTQLLHPLGRNVTTTAEQDQNQNQKDPSLHRRTGDYNETTAYPVYSSMLRTSLSSLSRNQSLDMTSCMDLKDDKATPKTRGLQTSTFSPFLGLSHPPTRVVLHIHPDKKASYTFFLPLQSENVLPKTMIAEKVHKIAQLVGIGTDRPDEDLVTCVSPDQNSHFSLPRARANNETDENDDTDRCGELLYSHSPILQSSVEALRDWTDSRSTSESHSEHHSEHHSEAYSEAYSEDMEIEVSEDGEGRFRSTKRFAHSLLSSTQCQSQMHDGDDSIISPLLRRKKRKENDNQAGFRRVSRQAQQAQRQVLMEKSQHIALPKKDSDTVLSPTTNTTSTTNCTTKLDVSTPLFLSPLFNASSSTASFSPSKTKKYALHSPSFLTTQGDVPLLTPTIQFQYTKKSLLQETSRYDTTSRSRAEFPISLRPQSLPHSRTPSRQQYPRSKEHEEGHGTGFLGDLSITLDSFPNAPVLMNRIRKNEDHDDNNDNDDNVLLINGVKGVKSCTNLTMLPLLSSRPVRKELRGLCGIPERKHHGDILSPWNNDNFHRLHQPLAHIPTHTRVSSSLACYLRQPDHEGDGQSTSSASLLLSSSSSSSSSTSSSPIVALFNHNFPPTENFPHQGANPSFIPAIQPFLGMEMNCPRQRSRSEDQGDYSFVSSRLGVLSESASVPSGLDSLSHHVPNLCDSGIIGSGSSMNELQRRCNAANSAFSYRMAGSQDVSRSYSQQVAKAASAIEASVVGKVLERVRMRKSRRKSQSRKKSSGTQKWEKLITLIDSILEKDAKVGPKASESKIPTKVDGANLRQGDTFGIRGLSALIFAANPKSSSKFSFFHVNLLKGLRHRIARDASEGNSIRENKHESELENEIIHTNTSTKIDPAVSFPALSFTGSEQTSRTMSPEICFDESDTEFHEYVTDITAIDNPQGRSLGDTSGIINENIRTSDSSVPQFPSAPSSPFTTASHPLVMENPASVHDLSSSSGFITSGSLHQSIASDNVQNRPSRRNIFHTTMSTSSSVAVGTENETRTETSTGISTSGLMNRNHVASASSSRVSTEATISRDVLARHDGNTISSTTKTSNNDVFRGEVTSGNERKETKALPEYDSTLDKIVVRDWSLLPSLGLEQPGTISISTRASSADASSGRNSVEAKVAVSSSYLPRKNGFRGDVPTNDGKNKVNISTKSLSDQTKDATIRTDPSTSPSNLQAYLLQDDLQSQNTASLDCSLMAVPFLDPLDHPSYFGKNDLSHSPSLELSHTTSNSPVLFPSSIMSSYSQPSLSSQQSQASVSSRSSRPISFSHSPALSFQYISPLGRTSPDLILLTTQSHGEREQIVPQYQPQQEQKQDHDRGGGRDHGRGHNQDQEGATAEVYQLYTSQHGSELHSRPRYHVPIQRQRQTLSPLGNQGIRTPSVLYGQRHDNPRNEIPNVDSLFAALPLNQSSMYALDSCQPTTPRSITPCILSLQDMRIAGSTSSQDTLTKSATQQESKELKEVTELKEEAERRLSRAPPQEYEAYNNHQQSQYPQFGYVVRDVNNQRNELNSYSSHDLISTTAFCQCCHSMYPVGVRCLLTGLIGSSIENLENYKAQNYKALLCLFPDGNVLKEQHKCKSTFDIQNLGIDQNTFTRLYSQESSRNRTISIDKKAYEHPIAFYPSLPPQLKYHENTSDSVKYHSLTSGIETFRSSFHSRSSQCPSQSTNHHSSFSLSCVELSQESGGNTNQRNNTSGEEMESVDFYCAHTLSRAFGEMDLQEMDEIQKQDLIQFRRENEKGMQRHAMSFDTPASSRFAEPPLFALTLSQNTAQEDGVMPNIKQKRDLLMRPGIDTDFSVIDLGKVILCPKDKEHVASATLAVSGHAPSSPTSPTSPSSSSSLPWENQIDEDICEYF